MIHEVDLELEVPLRAGDVHITIRIGDGQIGGSAMSLDGAAVGRLGEVRDFRVGSRDELIGRKLLVRTLVADVSEHTNWTSVRYQLRMADPLPDITARKEVHNDKEAVRFNTTFAFVDSGAGA